MSVSLLSLPPELLFQITKLTLSSPPRPLPLLLLNSQFHTTCLSILHSNLHFTSIPQLESFPNSCTHLSHRPRTLSIFLPGGTAHSRLFALLHNLLAHIVHIAPPPDPNSSKALIPKLEFRSIQFCLNSHAFNTNCTVLAEALSLTDPEEFIWTGPDPAHHFSTAIVPLAATYLFKAIRSWSNLRHLKLTNVSLPHTHNETGHSAHPLASALGALNSEFTLRGNPPSTQHLPSPSSPPMPHLRTIYLGQITHLPPSEIALIACTPALAHILSIRVVDAYQDSIWGPRVRNADVENAVASFLLGPGKELELELASVQDRADHRMLIERVKNVVSCEALTERIMGGDRMDGGRFQ